MKHVVLLDRELILLDTEDSCFCEKNIFVRGGDKMVLQIDHQNNVTHFWKKGEEEAYRHAMSISYITHWNGRQEGLQMVFDLRSATFISGQRNSVIL